jgi:hypothetical protein
MATVTKEKLSGSTDGRGVKVAATSTPGTTLHTATTNSAYYDELWIWAQNNDAADIVLTIEFGGVTSPDDLITVTIPTKSGLFLITPGLVLKGNATPLVVKAFAATANKIILFGFANRVML